VPIPFVACRGLHFFASRAQIVPIIQFIAIKDHGDDARRELARKNEK
jgi:hypothetical protein